MVIKMVRDCCAAAGRQGACKTLESCGNLPSRSLPLLSCRYQGVCLCGSNGRWQAQVTYKRKRHYLGECCGCPALLPLARDAAVPAQGGQQEASGLSANRLLRPCRNAAQAPRSTATQPMPCLLRSCLTGMHGSEESAAKAYDQGAIALLVRQGRGLLFC